MGKLKPIEEIVKQNSGDLLRLQLGTEDHVTQDKRELTTAVGYRFKDGYLYPVSGSGLAKMEVISALEQLGVDISSGKYFNSKILGYEVIRKHRLKK